MMRNKSLMKVCKIDETFHERICVYASVVPLCVCNVCLSLCLCVRVWREIEKRDIEYKLEKLYGIIKEYKINFQGTKLMTQSLRGGQLCQNCHPINLLK